LEVRQALAAVPVPESVERALEAAEEQFGSATAWAIRSSATLEDLPDASFAGQHDTFLNVRGREAILTAVHGCWVSLFTDRAIFYRLEHRMAHRSAAMAVVVQAMVPATAAGVLFTIDPVTGSAGRIVIEGTPGLGDRLVSGQVDPERVVLDKETLRVVERYAASGSNCLDEPIAQRLGALARKVERLFGGPQDIEWAADSGQVFLLQARPVTATRPARSWEDRQVWTNLNTGEVFPEVATPISWSMIRSFVTPLFGSIFRLFGADVTKGPSAGLVAGRIYFNVNTALAALRPFTLALNRVAHIAQALGGGQIQEYQQMGSGIPKEDLPHLGFSWLRYILSCPRILFDLIVHSPRRGAEFISGVQARSAKLARLDFASLPTPELARTFPRVLQENLERWDLLYLFTRAGALLVLQKACRDWLGDQDLSVTNRLFAGLGGLPETEAGLALWRLAALAHADHQTETVLRSKDRWQEVRVQFGHSEQGRQFLAAWGSFMAEHGHHCRGEIELSNARWAEKSDYVLDLVRNYLRSIDQSNPMENQRRLAAERRQLTQQCRQRLKNPIKRWLFSWSLKRVQQLAIDREVWKSEVVRHIALLRRMLLLLGERLQQHGVLARQDDIFFLEVSEIEPVGTGCACFNVKELVAVRRREYEANLRLNPPPVVKGRYDPTKQAVPAPDPGVRVLTGIPVFPGIVTGSARVILHADEHQQVQPGEILVAPFTDPAWTPYFLSAAGVVMDQGGILSHGSIIAREYGLPAVTNLGSATRIIRTGDQVQVDGNLGRVTILEREGTRP